MDMVDLCGSTRTQGRASKMKREAWNNDHDGNVEVIAVVRAIASISLAVTLCQGAV